MRQYSHSRKLQTSLQAKDIGEKWLVPCHVNGNHWALFALNKKKKTIVYLDSLGPQCPNMFRTDVMRKSHRLDVGVVQDLQTLLEATGNVGRWIEWLLVVPESIKRQVGGSDCGVHVCLYATCAITGKNQDFSPAMMSSHRRNIRRTIMVSIVIAMSCPLPPSVQLCIEHLQSCSCSS